MLNDEWIVRLLTRCEAGLGIELRQIRGNLSSREWLSALWELLLLDAALALGVVQYESTAPGRGNPDLLLDSHAGARLWIEAAFLRSERSAPARKVDDHPIFRVLKEKGAKAKLCDAPDPYVVFLGTDRVFDIDSTGAMGAVRPSQAVRKAFDDHRSLSAVVLVSIFARPEILRPLHKRPRPWLYANPSAHVPLTNRCIEVINLFDFERWPFDGFTRPNRKRPELREALKKDSRVSQTVNSALSFEPPHDAGRVPYPRWTYVWRFNRLHIAQIGERYWLFNGRESLSVSADAPEQVAQVASELFQIFPGHVIGPNGIEPHPDPGVPADLQKWSLEFADENVWRSRST
jgi:hypothetical protein